MESDPPPWYRDRRGVPLVGAYIGLAVLCGSITTGLVFSDLVGPGVNSPDPDAAPLAIPPQFFLYALLGTLTHVFVNLAYNPDSSFTTLLQLSLRLPAGLLVGVGVYLLSTSLGVDPTPAGTEAAQGLAALAFLAGLFVEHALRGLGVVSERLYPGNPKNMFES